MKFEYWGRGFRDYSIFSREENSTMTIKFHYDEVTEELPLSFDMVKTSQFFISLSGHLCQKCDEGTLNIIADASGSPMASTIRNIDGWSRIVQKMLPKITKITWE